MSEQASRSVDQSLKGATGWSLLLFATAGAIRSLILWQLTDSEVFNYGLSDGRAYQLWSRQLVEGGASVTDFLVGPPLYPLFMASLFQGLGESLFLVRTVQVVFGAFACVLLMQAGWQLRSKATGLIAGFLLAFYPIAIWSNFSIHTSAIDVFLVCLSLALIADYQARPSRGSILGLGLVLGLLFLSRESTFVLLLASVFVLAFRGKQLDRPGWTDAGLLVAGAAVLMIPALAIDWAAGGELRFLKAPLSYHLYSGNTGVESLDGRVGLFQPPISAQGPVAAVESRIGHPPTRSEVADFYENAFDRDRAESGDPISSVLFRKSLMTLNAVEPADTQEAWVHAQYSPPLEFLFNVIHFGWILPLAFFGAWVVWPERGRFSWLYAWSVVWLLWSVVFYHYGRHRLLILPVLLLLAAAGVAGASRFVQNRPRPVVVAAILSALFVLVIAQWPILNENTERSMAYHGVASGLGELGLEEWSILRMEDALAFDSDNAFAHRGIGSLYAEFDAFGMAELHFREAIRLRPDDLAAYRNLAEVQHQSYDNHGAIETYAILLTKTPKDAEVWLAKARIHHELGDDQEARFNLQRALSLDPDLAQPAAP